MLIAVYLEAKHVVFRSFTYQRNISFLQSYCYMGNWLVSVYVGVTCVDYWTLQAIHRHVPGLVRILGPSHPELLRIISGPPEGSENLIMQVQHSISILDFFYENLYSFRSLVTAFFFFCFFKVLELMTEDSTPSADLIASVKHLYDTKLKVVMFSPCAFFKFSFFLFPDYLFSVLSN